MRKRLKWTLAFVVLAGVSALLVWAFIEGREELARERERERPVKVPPRVSRTAEGTTIITLDGETQTRIALKEEILVAVRQHPEFTAYGLVLDPASLVTLSGELSSAAAALVASSAEFERAKTLYHEGENVSRRSLDVAEAQFHADENRAHLAVRQIAALWGDDVSRLAPAAREALVERLVARQTVFARVTLPPGEAMRTRPRAARVVILGYDDHPLTTSLVFDAPAVDPKNQGHGFLLRLDTQGLPVRPGTAVTAFLEMPEEAQQGVVIPRSAVIRFGGKTWAYVQVGETAFARREVPLEHATERGWFTMSSFIAGDRVVIAGAQLFLSEEFKSQIQVGEEGE